MPRPRLEPLVLGDCPRVGGRTFANPTEIELRMGPGPDGMTHKAGHPYGVGILVIDTHGYVSTAHSGDATRIRSACPPDPTCIR